MLEIQPGPDVPAPLEAIRKIDTDLWVVSVRYRLTDELMLQDRLGVFLGPLDTGIDDVVRDLMKQLEVKEW
jgi:hypothetical protein